MRAIDRLAEKSYGLTPFLLMEVAGLATARVARMLLDPPLSERTVVILAGPGNNGADGLVAARRLTGWGVDVSVFTSYDLATARGIGETQLTMASEAGATVESWLSEDDIELGIEDEPPEDIAADAADLGTYDLVIDALLGFGAEGEPRGTVAVMLEAAAACGRPILALDVPSGLNAETGDPAPIQVSAAATVTLALAKTGLLAEAARAYVGRLFLADIGIPRPLLADVGIDPEGLFEDGDLVELALQAPPGGP